jgi:hypothetical protein
VLQQLGLVKPGMNIAQITQSLVQALHGRGFGSATGALTQQLAQALSAFQQKHGLAVTGQLDHATATLLQREGLLGRAAGLAGGVLNVKDGFESARAADNGATSTSAKPEAAQQQPSGLAKAAAEGSQKAMEFLAGLFGFGGGRLAEGAAAGETGHAVPSQGGPLTDGAGAGAGRATDGRGDNTRAKNDGSGLLRERAGQTVASGTQERVRTRTGLKNPTSLGVDEESDDDEGRGGADGEGAGEGQGDGGGADGGEHDRGTRNGDAGGRERLSGNASSGDTHTADARRGHATLDEYWDADRGHYAIPQVAEQWRRALTHVRKDPASDNRTTTYTWDVRFYRPGVYGPGQKAEEILHLLVTEASAFDRAWGRSLEALTRLVERHDGPGTEVPLQEDMLRAIRRARVQ